MKYFVLDFDYGGSDAYMANSIDALRHATRDEPTEIVRFGREDYLKYPDPNKYLKHMTDELRDSDIIMGFTATNLIGFWGEYSGFDEILFDKINNRTPFFLQFICMWERVHYEDRDAKQYSSFLDKLKVYPTEYKVFESELFDECATQYTARFSPAEVDPTVSNVFENGDDIWIDGANLMTFGDGNTALLKSSDRHLHVNNHDLPTRRINYEQHSPFVIRKTENHYGYLVSGTFFAVNFDHATNPRSVGRANITAISNIVRDLQSNVRVRDDA